MSSKTESNFAYCMKYIHNKGDNLALHGWIPLVPRVLVFYIHGIQSHAGWLFETGPILASSGIGVFVLDRRGSGLSGGIRGDIPNQDTLFEDYHLSLQIIKEKHKKLPLILYGQSLGGSLLAGLLSWNKFSIQYDAVVFCAPGLGQQVHLSTHSEQKEIIHNKNLDNFTLGFKDTEYTTCSRYLKFIKNDPLVIREITNRARAVLLEIEQAYMYKQKIINVPSAFISSFHDPIINLNIAFNIFEKFSKNKKIILKLPTKTHYIEFSPQKSSLLTWLTHYALTLGYETCQ